MKYNSVKELFDNYQRHTNDYVFFVGYFKDQYIYDNENYDSEIKIWSKNVSCSGDIKF